MLGIPRDVKIKLLVSLIVVIVLAFIASAVTGCAFNHRGETSFTVLKDMETTSSGTSTGSFKRPARD